jgi:ABC-type antimicrobial peptide transport system permease subunit
LAAPEVRVNDRAVRAVGGAVFVSPNYFSMLGIRAEKGHAIEALSSEWSVVLGDGFWRRELGAGDVIGRTISINDQPFEVVGVAPRGFTGLTLGTAPDLYLPMDAMSAAQPAVITLRDRSTWQAHFVGRLKAGVAASLANERLTAWRARVEPPVPGHPVPIVRALPLDEGLSNIRRRYWRPLAVLMGMVALLLLVGCANVATMLLSRAATRNGEMVVRATMGAAEGRLVRQLLTESMLLVGAAGALGL